MFLKKFVLFTICLFNFSSLAVPLPFSKSDTLETIIRDSFSHRDFAGTDAIEDYNKCVSKENKLDEYKGLNDFSQPKKQGDFLPWRKGPFQVDGTYVQKLDLEDPKHAKIFSDIIFKYILEGWFSDKRGDSISNWNKHFEKNFYRTWCTTPGVVDGSSGREAVHGMTKELGLKPSPIFPEGQGVESFNDSLWTREGQDKRPSGWGQAFYNSVVCEKYAELFGKDGSRRLPDLANQKQLENNNGFLAFKLHFNAFEEWRSYRPLRGAYVWDGHVAKTRGENIRELRELPLLQISVSVKLDPRYIDGLLEEDGSSKADNWVMLAYYHDVNFNGLVPKVNYMPKPFQKMRPMGIQTGLTPKDTIIFVGSKSNYKMNDVDEAGEVTGVTWYPNDEETLLNGPADNAYSSCLGCHSGFTYMDALERKDPRRGGADGLSFFNVERFKKVRSKYGKRADFNLNKVPGPVWPALDDLVVSQYWPSCSTINF